VNPKSAEIRQSSRGIARSNWLAKRIQREVTHWVNQYIDAVNNGLFMHYYTRNKAGGHLESWEGLYPKIHIQARSICETRHINSIYISNKGSSSYSRAYIKYCVNY